MPTYALTVDDPDFAEVYFYPEVEAADIKEAAIEAYRKATEEDENGVGEGSFETPDAFHTLLTAAAHIWCYEGEPREHADESRGGWW